MGGKGESISVEELRELSQAVSSLKGEGSLEEERASLEELKEDREEYCEDVADLAVECRDEELKESKGSARLGRRVESMISKIDQAVQRLDRDFVSSSDGSLQKMQEERLGESVNICFILYVCVCVCGRGLLTVLFTHTAQK